RVAGRGERHGAAVVGGAVRTRIHVAAARQVARERVDLDVAAVAAVGADVPGDRSGGGLDKYLAAEAECAATLRAHLTRDRRPAGGRDVDRAAVTLGRGGIGIDLAGDEHRAARGRDDVDLTGADARRDVELRVAVGARLHPDVAGGRDLDVRARAVRRLAP